jgi:hypothetical protein
VSPIDRIELSLFEIAGDIELAGKTGVLMRRNVECGVITEEDVAKIRVTAA